MRWTRSIPLALVGACALVLLGADTRDQVRSLEVEETERATRLVVRGVDKPTFTSYKHGDPPRVYVDISQTDVSALKTLPVDNGVVRSVAAEQLAGGVGRLVVSLDRDAVYEVKAERGALVIRVDGLGRTKGPAAADRGPAALRRLEAEVRARLRAEEARITARRQELEAAMKEAAANKGRAKRVRTQMAGLESDLTALRDRSKEEEARLLALREAVAAEGAKRQAAEDAAAKARRARKLAEASTASSERKAALAEVARQEAVRAAAESEAASIAKRRDGEIATRLAALEARVEQAERRAVVHAEAAQAAIAAARRVQSESGRVKLTDVRFEDLADRSRVIIEATGPLAHKLQRSKGKQVVLQLNGVAVPRALERKLDTSAFSSPVVAITSYGGDPSDGRARVIVDLGERTDSRVDDQGRRLLWEFRKRGASPKGWKSADAEPATPGPRPGIATQPGSRVGAFTGAGAAPTFATLVDQKVGPGFGKGASGGGASAPRRFTGKRITIDLKDADIHNVLRLLAKEGRINIIASEDVAGTITLHLERIPWDQALDVILRTKGLTQRREGDIVWVTPLKILKEQEKIRVEVKKAQEELEPLEVRLITVNYAEGGGLIEQVKSVLSDRGSAVLDSRTNTIIIKDISEHADAAEDLVRRLDSQTPLILIEARIVEASSSFVDEMGIQWGGDFLRSPAFGNPTGLIFPGVASIKGGIPEQGSPTSGTSTTPNWVVSLPAPAGTGSGGALGFIFGSVGDSANLNLRLSAAETSGSLKLLASPRVATLDNTAARILQGVQIPFSQVSAQGVQTAFSNADLSLDVTPHVTQDGNVILAAKITKNTPDFSRTGTDGTPTILRKEAQTEMMVKDGDTAVIGGIYTKEESVTVKQVPFFGDIPIIGALFRFTKTEKTRAELLMFITPRIVNRSASVVRGGRAGGTVTFK